MGMGSTGTRPSTSLMYRFAHLIRLFGKSGCASGPDKPIHREKEMTIEYSKKLNWFAASWFGQFMASSSSAADRATGGW